MSLYLRNVVFGLVSFAIGVGTVQSEKPNIVLIMADDMGFECVQANGGTSYQTPCLNQLADQGMRFLHCHSQPICTPSRVQIMTGIYNHRNYIEFGLLDPRARTFAHVLKESGYRTCVVGKWQLKGGLDGPRKFGFDEYCLWQLTRRPGRYPNPGLEINGKEVDFTNGEYGPDIVSDYLCDFIERHQAKPFFAYYPMILPHWPFEPTPDSADWDPKANGVLNGVGELKYFADMVTYTDKLVGKVVAKLDQLQLRKNTLVIFTCDNGTYTKIHSAMGEKIVQGGKGSTTDNGTHVPLIASFPGKIEQGSVSRSLVDFSDFLPTLADFASTSATGLDGQSFRNKLLGDVSDSKKWIYCWYERNGRRDQASRHIRNARFKLYADERFYDLSKDPHEQRPLSLLRLDSSISQTFAEMKAALLAVEKKNAG